MTGSKWLWLAILALLALPASAEVLFQHAYVRLLPPGVPDTAGYFVIVNRGSQTRIIESFDCDCAQRARLHRTVNNDGMVTMKAIASLPIKTGQTLQLAPGGLHLMLMGLVKPLSLHQQVTLTAHFHNGQSQSFTAEVLSPLSAPALKQ